MKHALVTFCLTLLLAAAATCGVLFSRTNRPVQADSVRGHLFLPALQSKIDDITRIEMVNHRGGITRLVKADKGVWLIPTAHDFPADVSNIMNSLYVFARLRAAQAIDNPERMPSLFAQGQIGFYAGEQCVDTLFIGAPVPDHTLYGQAAQHAAPLGRYYRSAALPQGAVSAESFSLFENGVMPWFTKEFTTIDNISSMTLAIPSAQRAQAVWRAERTRPDTTFALLKNYPALDEKKLTDYAQFWQKPRFLNVVPRPENVTPVYLLHIQTFENFTYQILFYTDNGRCYFTYDVDFDPAQLVSPMRWRDAKNIVHSIPRAPKAYEDKLLLENHYTRWSYELPKQVFDFFTRPSDRSGTDAQQAQ